MDPQAAQQILESLFTLSGGAVAAAIIASFIQVLKPIGGVGAWIESGHEYVVAFIASIGLVAFAVAALGKPLDLVSLFGYLLAWLALATLVGKAYDAGRATKAAVAGVASGVLVGVVLALKRLG